MYIKKIFSCVLLVMITLGLRAQSAPAEALANHIAQKMKDSLSLSALQKQNLYMVNLQLHYQKQALRQQYTNADSVRIKMQGIENTRDSLYRPVLTSQQYDLYKEKKRALISAN